MTIAALGRAADHCLLVTDDVVITAKGSCRRDKILRIDERTYASVVGDELVLTGLAYMARWMERPPHVRDSQTVYAALRVAERLRQAYQANGHTLMAPQETTLLVCTRTEAYYWIGSLAGRGGFNPPQKLHPVQPNSMMVFYGGTPPLLRSLPVGEVRPGPFDAVRDEMLSVQSDQQRLGQTLSYTWNAKTLSGVKLPVGTAEPARVKPFSSVAEEILMESPGAHHLLADASFLDIDLSKLPWRSPD